MNNIKRSFLPRTKCKISLALALMVFPAGAVIDSIFLFGLGELKPTSANSFMQSISFFGLIGISLLTAILGVRSNSETEKADQRSAIAALLINAFYIILVLAVLGRI